MSLLWVEAARAKPVSVPVEKILREYRPTEGVDWDTVRDIFEDEHPVMMRALREDLSQRGLQRPVQAFAEGDGWAIHNGHHRILTAQDVGLAHIPVEHYQHVHEIPGDKEYWDPETKTHYGPDEDDDDEGQVRY